MEGHSLTRKRKVFLFKAAPEDEDKLTDRRSSKKEDHFVTSLNSHEIENELIPVLSFQYSNLDKLWSCLEHPEEYSGIIFTSLRCVTSVQEAIKLHNNSSEEDGGTWEGSLKTKWISKQIFCVGPSTKDKVLELFGEVVEEKIKTGAESNAGSLADKIIETNSERNNFPLPILYPCGSLRRDVLLQKLNSVKIACSEVIVYETGKDPKLKDKLALVVKEEIKTGMGIEGKETKEFFFCFFSPSGVKYVMEDLEVEGEEEVSKLFQNDLTKTVSIGPTTTSFLQQKFTEMGVGKEILQCEEPTPEALLKILRVS